MDEAIVEDRPVLPGQLHFFWDEDPEEPTAQTTPVKIRKSKASRPKSAPAATVPSEQKKPAKAKAAVAQERESGHNPKAPRARSRKAASPPAEAPAELSLDGAAISDFQQPEAVSASEHQESAAADSKPSANRKRKVASAAVAKSAKKKAASGGRSASQAARSVASRTKRQKQDATVADPVESPSLVQKSYHESMESISLKWGARLPKVGFGFWKVEKDQTAEVCRTAIEVGYRHLDCACDYGNETEVGQGIAAAIREGLCDREDLWVTSKLWNTYHAPEHVLQACERSLNDLGLDYLDLYLIHFPIAQRYVPFETRYPPGWFFNPNTARPVVEEARVPISDTWRAMEELALSGKVRNIGICNFGTSQIRDLLSYAKIRPAVLQVETHPYLTQEKLLRYCQQEKIAYTAFSPLGAQSYFSLGMADPSEAALQNPVVTKIAAAVKRTPAQVLLRWGTQRGTAVIPKTSSRDRMIENINLFDFQLTDAQMQAISALDQGRRFNDPGHFGEAAFNTFLPIYE
ncbi:MAG: aldo/keto reductase [Planctomycetaceae bacterium]